MHDVVNPRYLKRGVSGPKPVAQVGNAYRPHLEEEDDVEENEQVVQWVHEEPGEEQKRLWNLYALTAGTLELVCHDSKGTGKLGPLNALESDALLTVLWKQWAAIYGPEYMENAARMAATQVSITLLQANRGK